MSRMVDIYIESRGLDATERDTLCESLRTELGKTDFDMDEYGETANFVINGAQVSGDPSDLSRDTAIAAFSAVGRQFPMLVQVTEIEDAPYFNYSFGPDCAEFGGEHIDIPVEAAE